MKTLTNRLVSFILVFALTISLCTPAFAAEHSDIDDIEHEIGTADDIQAAREAYFSLSPEAKEIFDSTLADTPELLKFHTTYVDQDFCTPMYAQSHSASAVGEDKADPMTVLMAELSALALPTAVLYSLKAVGAGMVASVADGPLLAGDILLAAAAVSAAATIALSWDQVSPLWNNIVKAFQKAFSDSANNVLTAFNDIKKQILEIVSSEVSVTVSGRVITVGDTKYECNTKAQDLTTEQQKDKKYFPAVLYKKVLYVDPLHNLSNSTAKTILKLNSSVAGIWATSDKYAKGIVGNNPIWHNVHDYSEGYFLHYHPSNASHAHCWYPS